jgi:hypothetical protein
VETWVSHANGFAVTQVVSAVPEFGISGWDCRLQKPLQVRKVVGFATLCSSYFRALDALRLIKGTSLLHSACVVQQRSRWK